MQKDAINNSDKKATHPLPEDYHYLADVWQQQESEPGLIDYRQSCYGNPALTFILDSSPCVTSILNLRMQQFDFISSNTEKILGYDSSYFREKGLAFCNEIAHSDDLAKTWKLIKNIWDFILDVPPAEQEQFKFNHDYRIIKPDGKEAKIFVIYIFLCS